MSMPGYSQAVGDFRRARRRAALRSVFARWAGNSPRLLSYEDVRRKLKARETAKIELKEIPLDAIVGSVGRYDDFTRGFLPRRDSSEGRWAGVKVAVTGLGGLPPIEVYQIGDAYFVLDGNHRVSVARDVGASQIEAYVRKMDTKVPLSPDIQPDDLLIKAEYAEFLDRTSFDEIAPQIDLTVTLPGRYPVLLDQISAHQDHLNKTEDRKVSLREAAAAWVQQVYAPTVEVIRQQGLLRDFSGRTETDLYVWMSQHTADLERELGWEVKRESVASNLAAQSSPRLIRRFSRAKKKVFDALTPDPLDSGPAPGIWRRDQLGVRGRENLAANILVAVSGEEHSWSAVDQALIVAQREGARLQGLHVVKSEDQVEGEKAKAVRVEFERRTDEVGVSGRLAVEVGGVARKICERARWSDFVVVHLAHPPGTRTIARLGSGFRTMILRCPTPILAVPRSISPMNHAILAYDGSRKAKEALYLSTYLASRWNISLVIVSVAEAKRVTEETLREAQSYAERHDVTPVVVSKKGDVAEAVLQTANETKSDFTVIGGYGHSPVIEAALGSAIDHILRESDRPVLICR
jgi:nucleotide-binding universal stress UspA family protein